MSTAPVTVVTEQCPPVCATLLAHNRVHASGCVHYVNPYGMAWCSTCRRRVQIEDQYTEDTGDSRVIVEVWSVSDLACGHQTSHRAGEYRSPLQQAGESRAQVLGRADALVSPW